MSPGGIPRFFMEITSDYANTVHMLLMATSAGGALVVHLEIGDLALFVQGDDLFCRFGWERNILP